MNKLTAREVYPNAAKSPTMSSKKVTSSVSVF